MLSKFELTDLLKEMIECAEVIQIPVSRNIDTTVKINPNPTSRWGQCSKKGSYYTIELTEIAATNKAAACAVLAHEILHTCPGCMNHGKKWQEYAKKFTKEWGIAISRVNGEHAGLKLERKVAHEVACTGCGQIWKYSRHSKVTLHPASYRCTKCKSPLKLFFYFYKIGELLLFL